MIIVPPVHSSGSPAALELAQKLSNAISEYQQTHPGVSASDIREAIRIAQTSAGAGTNRRIAVVLATGLAMLLAFSLVPMFGRVGHGHGSAFMMPWAMIVIMLGVFVIAMKARR
jgi:lipopolysaccharide export LptBFGC system permease protein LptF